MYLLLLVCVIVNGDSEFILKGFLMLISPNRVYRKKPSFQAFFRVWIYKKLHYILSKVFVFMKDNDK